MRKKGLVSQEQDASDRRKQNVAITPQGQAIIEDNLERAAQIAEGYVSWMGQEEYEKLLDLLEILGKR